MLPFHTDPLRRREADPRIPFVDLARQTESIADEVREAMLGVVEDGNFILGSQLEQFEVAFAQYIGVRHAVGVGSGFDALRLTLIALDVGSDDEVILPANTFIATALAVSSVGARPVLVDCDRHTYNIDVSRLDAAITTRTRAIIPVHLTGQSVEMDAILELAAEHHVPVIEDACQAHGAAYRDQRCGSFGAAGCFSFYPGKNLGAFGDGGLVTTDNELLAQRLRRLRNYGQEAKYQHTEMGVNSRLDTLQAAVLGVKLRYLDKWNSARTSHAAEYLRLLEGVGDLRFQARTPHATHVYHLFMVESDHRDALQQHLADRDIQTGIHYPTPIHLQEAYSEQGYQQGDFPVAELLSKRILSLPMFPELTTAQVARVADAARSFFGK